MMLLAFLCGGIYEKRLLSYKHESFEKFGESFGDEIRLLLLEETLNLSKLHADF